MKLKQFCNVHCAWCHLRKLIPTAVLVVLTAIAGGTNVFGQYLHQIVTKARLDFTVEAAPYIVHVLLAAIAVNVFWLLYRPTVCGVQRFLNDNTTAREDVKSFVIRALRLIYWLAVAFFIVSTFAEGLMEKLALSGGLVTAAVAFAVKGILNDFVCGLLLQFSNRVKEGESLKVVGIDGADGTVRKISYIETVLQTDQGDMTIPNGTIWGNCTVKRAQAPAPAVQAETKPGA